MYIIVTILLLVLLLLQCILCIFIDVFQCILEAVTALKAYQQQLTKGFFRPLSYHTFDLLKLIAVVCLIDTKV